MIRRALLIFTMFGASFAHADVKSPGPSGGNGAIISSPQGTVLGCPAGGGACAPSGLTALPNGMTATTQAVTDTSTDVATNAFVAALFASPPTIGSTTPGSGSFSSVSSSSSYYLNAVTSANSTGIYAPAGGTVGIEAGGVGVASFSSTAIAFSEPVTSPNQPRIIFQSGMPFILPSSGSMGNNCAITLTTALGQTYAAGFIYLPAGAIQTSSAAGWYYVAMSSTTAGTCYNNTYSSGQPEIPGSPTAFSSTGPGAFTQTTGVALTAISTSIPAGAMGVNGAFQYYFTLRAYNSATSKTISPIFGGNALGSTSAITTAQWYAGNNITVTNRGSASSQVSMINGGGSQGTGYGFNTYSVNTANAVTVSYTLELNTAATDWIVLESSSGVLYPAQ